MDSALLHVWWTRVWVATDGSSPVQSLLSSDWEQRGLLEADNAVLEFGMRSDPQHAKAAEKTAQHALHLGAVLKAAWLGGGKSNSIHAPNSELRGATYSPNWTSSLQMAVARFQALKCMSESVTAPPAGARRQHTSGNGPDASRTGAGHSPTP